MIIYRYHRFLRMSTKLKASALHKHGHRTSLKHKKTGFYLQPTIIMATEKIFSPSVVGAMFPNPMVVRLVMVK